MKSKPLFALVVLLLSCAAFAQTKEFSFSQFQIRNNAQKWEKSKKITPRKVHFTPEVIDLKVDRNYHLNIVSTTNLPDNGVIFLCKDEKQQDVTVMLIGDSRMFLYCESKRFLIDFNEPIVASAGKSYADID